MYRPGSGFLCATSVASVSQWLKSERSEHHRDTEDAEVAQRRELTTIPAIACVELSL